MPYKKKSRWASAKELAKRGAGFGVGALAAAQGAYRQHRWDRMLARGLEISEARAARRLKASARTKSKRVEKRVSAVERRLKGTTGTFTYRQRDNYFVEIPTNQSRHETFPVNNQLGYEAALQEVPRYDAATNTIVPRDFTSTAYSRQYLFSEAQSTIWINNNAKIPVRAKLYVLKPRSDTSITPTVAIQNGVPDQMLSPQSLSTLLFPTDIDQFNDLWKIVKLKSVTLHPGVPLVLTHSEKDIYYDPSLTDSHPQQYQVKNKSFVFFLRLEGLVAHSANNSALVGATPAAVDVQVDKKYVLEYDSGQSDTRFYRFVDNSEAVSDGVIAQPVVANQMFTAAAGTF